ncbi:CPBP family intramembrane glutamic endopeptidase [Microbulbifer mangrovi]|uniref:CPBP family intramembrane glutamic endopeptidase n=1 Tax=Microbulbifer mangrovi TaxID=927787 RepID=UPI0009907FE1|nr:type II CAAX endopeptidase family protein [Microbulbifer mangrovi]
MESLELALLFVLLLLPVVDVLLERFKSKSKSVEYIKISVVLWSITIFLIYSFYEGALSVNNPNFLPKSIWKIYASLLLFTTLILYLIYVVATIYNSEKVRQQVMGQFQSAGDSVLGLLPETRKEFLLFTLLLSVTAGICEELIFRWYLYSFLEGQVHWLIAVFMSSLLFGLWHLYLGWGYVVKTSVMGAILCGVYLYFESILIAIIAHILMDVYSGAIAYYARNGSIYVPNNRS